MSASGRSASSVSVRRRGVIHRGTQAASWGKMSVHDNVCVLDKANLRIRDPDQPSSAWIAISPVVAQRATGQLLPKNGNETHLRFCRKMRIGLLRRPKKRRRKPYNDLTERGTKKST
jgi:hypothetical protein